MFKPTSASLLISENCNLSCRYCFETHKKNIKMSNDIAIKSYDFLANNLKYNQSQGSTDDRIEITLFGGEPMLNFETIKHILEYSNNNETKAVFSIITNGTIMNEEISNYLANHYSTYKNISIQLSIDGIKEFQDYNRIFHDGRGSFDVIEKNIPLFKNIFGGENFRHTSNRPYLHVHGSLDTTTIKGMHSSWNYFFNTWKIPAIWFMPIHNEEWSANDISIYDEELTKIANSLLALSIKNKNIQYIKDFAPLNKGLNLNRSNVQKMCGAGDTYIGITATGDIYPCHEFYYLEDHMDFCLGNLDSIDESKRLMFCNYENEDTNCSKKGCDVYSCYRCPAENYKYNGSIINCRMGNRCKMSAIENRLIKRIHDVLIHEGLVK